MKQQQMKKRLSLYIISFLTLVAYTAKAQSTIQFRNQADSFSKVTKGKIWTISKYLSDSGKVERKALFTDIVLQFNHPDSTKFQINIAGQKRFFGQWAVQNNNSILFSMPLITDVNTGDIDTTNTYNKAVQLLCSWPLRKVGYQAGVVDFLLLDPFKGEVFIQLKEKTL
jgi:hypothetical protein